MSQPDPTETWGKAPPDAERENSILRGEPFPKREIKILGEKKEQ